MTTSVIHPGTKLGEVRLKVSNLERSLQFYCEVLGFRALHSDNGTASLSADGTRPLLTLEQPDNPVVTPPGTASGLYHYALLLPNRADLGLVLRRLSAAGIEIGQADHLVSEALYISDPDYNGIEIYRDRPRAEWRVDASGQYVMATDPIDWEGLLRESEGMEWSGLPEQTTIGHVHFHVRDLAEAERFYVDILGFEIKGDYRSRMRALFVSAGGYHHHIGLNTWARGGAPTPAANATGLARYTIELPDRAELDRVLGRLRAADIGTAEHPEGWLVSDPVGIVCLLRVGSPSA